MKYLLLLLLMPFTLQAQEIIESPDLPINPATNTIEYTDIVKADSLNKQQLFSCVVGWFNNHFEVAHMELSMADLTTGHVMGRGTVFGKHSHGLAVTAFTVSFLIDVKVKNGLYKYRVTNFNILAGLTSELLPDWISANEYIRDPKSKNKKGEYTGTALKDLAILDGQARYMINSLKSAINLKNALKVDDF